MTHRTRVLALAVVLAAVAVFGPVPVSDAGADTNPAGAHPVSPPAAPPDGGSTDEAAADRPRDGADDGQEFRHPSHTIFPANGTNSTTASGTSASGTSTAGTETTAESVGDAAGIPTSAVWVAAGFALALVGIGVGAVYGQRGDDGEE